MQFKKLVLGVFSVVLLICSCLEQQGQIEEPYLSVSVHELIAPSDGCSSVILITTNNSWTITAPDWCKVSSLNGTYNDKKVVVTVLENTSYDSRCGELNISSGKLTETIEILQEASEAMFVPDIKFELSYLAQILSVKIEANVEYEIDADSDWIHYIGTKSLTEYVCQFSIDENDSYDARVGYLSIKNKKSGDVVSVMVRQAQKNAIILSETDYYVSSEEHSLQIKLLSNVDVMVEIPESAENWITIVDTKALEEHYLCLNIAANCFYDERTCEIVVCDTSKTVYQTLNIEQAAQGAVFISNKEYIVSCESHVLSVDIQTNVDYEVVISQNAEDWIRHISTKALSDKIVSLQVDKNESYDNRSGEVYIRAVGSVISDTLIVKQAQNDQMLVSQNTFVLSGKEQILSTSIMTNVDVSVIIPGDAVSWLTLVETKALEEKVLSFAVSRNSSESVRETQVLIEAEVNGKKVYEALLISQKNIVTMMSILMKDETEISIDLYDDSKVFFNLYEICVISGEETYNIPMEDIKSIKYIQ